MRNETLSHITKNDLERSCSSRFLNDILSTLDSYASRLHGQELLDIGCGYGGIAATVRDRFEMSGAQGIDIDEKVRDEANAKGVDMRVFDLSHLPLPYPDNSFGLITSFGVLDYLPWFDDAILEIRRVLIPDGLAVISLPNLASWHNRLFLALGYQPRDMKWLVDGPSGTTPFTSAPLRTQSAIFTRPQPKHFAN